MGTKATPQTERLTCPPDHPHAKNRGCYTGHKCRCAPCTENVRVYNERFRKAKAYGRPTTRLVPAQPVLEHVWDLRWAGLSAKRAAELAQVSPGAINNLLNRRPERIRSDLAEALLSVPADPRLSLHRDPRGTHRRLQALVVQGWSLARLSEHLGLCETSAGNILEKSWVTQSTHARVAAMFDELWDKRPPLETRGDKISYKRSRAYAARMGWLPPLAWDDIDTDIEPPKQEAA